MTGLVLKLNPHERVLINGAVIENGERRSKLAIITPKANILRLRDAIRPDQANTPVRRVCYIAQLVLSGDIVPTEAREQFLRGVSQLSQAFMDDDSHEKLSAARQAAEADDYYRAMKLLRGLIPREDALLGRAV